MADKCERFVFFHYNYIHQNETKVYVSTGLDKCLRAKVSNCYLYTKAVLAQDTHTFFTEAFFYYSYLDSNCNHNTIQSNGSSHYCQPYSYNTIAGLSKPPPLYHVLEGPAEECNAGQELYRQDPVYRVLERP